MGKNNVPNGYTNPNQTKSQSFEDALNAATYTKKPVKAKIVKPAKSRKRAIILPSKTDQPTLKEPKLSPKKQSLLSPKKAVTSTKPPSKKNEVSMKDIPVHQSTLSPKILKKVEKSPVSKSNIVAKIIADQSRAKTFTQTSTASPDIKPKIKPSS